MRRSFPANLIIFVTNIIIGFVLAILALRVLLKLFGANPAAPFVDWVYSTTAPLVAPFSGIFPSPVLDGAFIIEFSALFALIIYALIAYLIYQLVDFLTYAASRRMEYGENYKEGAVFHDRRDEEDLRDEDRERKTGRGRRGGRR